VIADWQKARSQAATGFLTVTQQQTLLREAAAAVSRFDEAHKKAEDDKRITEEAKRKADDEAKARLAAIAPPVASPPAAVSLSSSPDGLWRGTYSCTAVSSNTSPQSYTLDLQLKLANGTSSGGGVLPSRRIIEPWTSTFRLVRQASPSRALRCCRAPTGHPRKIR
jgi:hypothetical protein